MLYIVSTPIGNLEDITLRALRILKEVNAVIAEDTRRTRPLLTHFGIQKELISYSEYSKGKKVISILKRLQEGENLALVSDAGTPVLSDPGSTLVASAHQRGIVVIPIPGPSAMLTALVASGFLGQPLHFWGFLSPSRSKRRKLYQTIVSLKGCHCFYVTPHKLPDCLEEWKGVFAGHSFFIGREMTKKFEEFVKGNLEEVSRTLKESEIRGEYTVLLTREKSLDQKLDSRLASG